MAGNVKWTWWASSDAENYRVGPCDTREAVLTEGAAYYDGEGGFYIVEAIQGSADRLIPNAASFIEQALEAAADDGAFGDDGDCSLRGQPEDRRAALAELDSAISAWVEKHRSILPTPWAFEASRNEEWIAGPAEQDADSASDAERKGPPA